MKRRANGSAPFARLSIQDVEASSAVSWKDGRVLEPLAGYRSEHCVPVIGSPAQCQIFCCFILENFVRWGKLTQ
jgi:hypothetical protein